MEADEAAIIQYWHSEDVPTDVAELVMGFRELNPDLNHQLFHEAEAEEFIRSHYTEREVAAFRTCAVPAMQADYFRYCAVLALGGLYADAGLRCRRRLRNLIESIDDGLLLRKEDPPEVVVNGLFVFDRPGHPLLRLVLDVATANIERRVAGRVNMVTGPWIFSGLAELYRLGSLEAAREAPLSPGLERVAGVMREVVGSFERVATAFAGVQIETLDWVESWIDVPPAPLRYKHGEDHWIDWEKRRGSIFR
jgi:mannosyltransferase OCH1-like enzyme